MPASQALCSIGCLLFGELGSPFWQPDPLSEPAPLTRELRWGRFTLSGPYVTTPNRPPRDAQRPHNIVDDDGMGSGGKLRPSGGPPAAAGVAAATAASPRDALSRSDSVCVPAPHHSVNIRQQKEARIQRWRPSGGNGQSVCRTQRG